MKGPVVALVGPSGVGKDSVMAAMVGRDPKLRLMRRVITRAADAGGEEYEAVSEAEFARRAEAGAFALHWPAHGLHYGVPHSIEALRMGASGVLVNLSRAVLLRAQEAFDDFRVIELVARPEVLAERLSARGREDASEVARRLARAGLALPEGLRQHHRVDNSGALDAAVTAALAIVQAAPDPVRG